MEDNRLDSGELAERYGIDREQMQDLLGEIGARGVDMAGERHYNEAEVAALLAQRDTKDMKETVAVLDAIENPEMARAILDESLEAMFKHFSTEASESLRAAVLAARRTVAGRLNTFALQAARQAVTSAPTAAERTAREWALLRRLDEFRVALMKTFAEHRTARRQDCEHQKSEGTSCV